MGFISAVISILAAVSVVSCTKSIFFKISAFLGVIYGIIGFFDNGDGFLVALAFAAFNFTASFIAKKM